jgi:hypothetical protein
VVTNPPGDGLTYYYSCLPKDQSAASETLLEDMGLSDEGGAGSEDADVTPQAEGEECDAWNYGDEDYPEECDEDPADDDAKAEWLQKCAYNRKDDKCGEGLRCAFHTESEKQTC